jgi:predicted MFS family arabinose efflux permease
VVGFLAAPLLDRFPRGRTVCLGLVLVAVGALLPLLGSLAALVASFFVVGSALSVLMPAIQAAGGDLFEGPAAGRAASLVNAVQGLSNVLAGPILALPALIAGWQGVYVGMAGAAMLTAACVAPRLSWTRPQGVARTGYREAFALVARAPGAVALLVTATLRACVQLAWLAFLAAAFADRFQADVAAISLVWVVGAGSFSVANLLAARFVNVATDRAIPWWRSAEGVLLATTIASVVTVPLAYVVSTFALAMVANVLYAVTAGASIAALVSILMRRYPTLRGAVMGLNAAGTNVGTVLGTAIASVGLGLGGYVGLAATLVVLAVATVGALLVALRQLERAPAPGL